MKFPFNVSIATNGLPLLFFLVKVNRSTHQSFLTTELNVIIAEKYQAVTR